jgi:sugar lactone lactonase YvrE
MTPQTGFLKREVFFMQGWNKRSQRGLTNDSRGNPVKIEPLECRRHLDGALAADLPVVMSGLDNPRGLDFGPQGALYVAEAGRGGGVGAPNIVLRGTPLYYGATGAVSRLWKGQQERVASGLPSLAHANGNEGGGPQGISFNGAGNAYLTVGFGADPSLRGGLGSAGAGFAQLIRLKPNGNWSSVADLGTYELNSNPDGRQLDTNPFGVRASPGGQVVVTDSGANSLLRVDNHGGISTIAVMPTLPPSQAFSGDAVPTGFTVGPDGAYYVGILSGAPFRDGAANIYRVVPGESPTVFRSGFKTILDIDFDDAGNLYVLQHSSGPAGLAGPGSLLRVAPDGTRSALVGGLTAPTSLAIGDGAVYVTNFGAMAGRGQVLRVDLEPGGAAGSASRPDKLGAKGLAKDGEGGILRADGNLLA